MNPLCFRRAEAATRPASGDTHHGRVSFRHVQPYERSDGRAGITHSTVLQPALNWVGFLSLIHI